MFQLHYDNDYSEDYYFIFIDHKVKYLLGVSNSNSEKTSTFQPFECDDLNIDSNMPKEVAIIFLNEKINVYVNNKLYDLDSNEVFIDIDNTTFDTNYLEETPINVSNTYSPKSRSAYITGKHIDVDIIKNVEINKRGMCWAACAASKVNYQNKQWNFDANGIYYYALRGYTGEKCGDVDGNSLRYIYDQYVPGTIVRRNLVLSTTGIYNALNAGKPIQIYIDTSTGTTGHSLIIRGVNIYNDMIILSVMDPNYSNYVEISLSGTPDKATNNFRYRNYDIWFLTAY